MESNQKIKDIPLFNLGSYDLSNLPASENNQKHVMEYEAMVAKVKKLDMTIHDLLSKVGRLHHKRTKMASIISKFVNNNSKMKIRNQNSESTSVKQQNERMNRLNACSKLLNNRYTLSSIIQNQPLPDLPAPIQNDDISKYGFNDEKSSARVNKISQFLRLSQPDVIINYLNDSGLSFLLILCNSDTFESKPLKVDLKSVHQVYPQALSSVSPPTRQILLKSFFKAMISCANLTTFYEESFQDSDTIRLINIIETHAGSLVNARRARLFVGSDQADELIHMNGNVRVIVPLSHQGLIADCVNNMKYEIIQDPKSSPIIDVAVETSLFEGARNAIICPFKYPNHKLPFVFVAVDKLRDSNFSGVDNVLLHYLFKILAICIEKVHRAITKVTEDDQRNLIQGIATIANETNSHEMIQKITEVGNSLTSATSCRLFSIIDDTMFEETPGLKIQNKTIPVDLGLIGKAVISGETQNYVLPRREPEFSAQADDITEPRVWAMLSSPLRYDKHITMNMTLYNRQYNTFFSAKESILISTLAKCICPFLYRACKLAKLKESLSSDSENSARSYNLTVFSLKAIETAGTEHFFDEMKRFCDSLNPVVSLRILVYDVDKLIQLPEMKIVTSEPQLLDAICNMKPTAATNDDNRAVLVFPIKFDDINKVFLIEFSAELLKLKTADEENGLIQRARIIQSVDDAGTSNFLSNLHDQYEENNYSLLSQPALALPQQAGRVGFGGLSSRSFSFHVPANDSLSQMHTKLKMPFISLSKKSTHEDNRSTTSLFDLAGANESNKGSDKLIVIQSGRRQKVPTTPTQPSSLLENGGGSFNIKVSQQQSQSNNSQSYLSLSNLINNNVGIGLQTTNTQNNDSIVAASQQPLSFDEQLDEDSLQIFPFDQFLTSILQSFSNHSARQILLHMKISSMNKYQVTTRSLHALGNSLASPLMFSKLLQIMMAAFTNLFGKDVKIKIFDPPLNDVAETDPTTFNLERDRMIFASIKIPTALNMEKSTALASFADLLTNLIESRAQSIPSKVMPPTKCDTDEEAGLDFECSHLTSSEMIIISLHLFIKFHVIECLKCDEEIVTKWLGQLASKTDESGLFMMMTDSLHFTYFLLKSSGWMEHFTPQELCAIGLAAFLVHCTPQMHPNFQYESIVAKAVTKETPQRSLTKVLTGLILLADDSINILENVEQDMMLQLTKLMLEQMPKQPLGSLLPFHVVVRTKKLDLSKPFHKLVLKRFLMDVAQNSLFFSPISSFGVWLVSFGKEPIPNVILKAKAVMLKFADELAAACDKFEALPKMVDDKVEWMKKQNLKMCVGRQQEEEDEGNMSLFDAH